jgi:hydrogenase-4 membrane subunit HyfE
MKAGGGVRRAARSFIVLGVAVCIVAALLGGALLTARHGTHRFYCPDKNCKICFSVAAHLSLVQSWGIIAARLWMLVLAAAVLGLLAQGASARVFKDTLFALGIRLNS